MRIKYLYLLLVCLALVEGALANQYSIISGNFSWPAAKADAELRGGHLATLTDSNEVQYVEATLGQAVLSKRLWLGATDQNVEGVWKWITGEPWTWGSAVWWTGNPSDSYGNEDFLEAQDFGNVGKLRFNDLGPIGYGDNQGYLLEKESNSSNLPSSVVGTWEITVSGNDKGTAFITFSPDSTLSGYGISVNSFGLFTFTGTWSFDIKGRIVGSITEQLRGQSYLLNFIGTAKNGTKLQVSAVGQNGSFKLKGSPAVTLPNLSGHYMGYVKQPGLSFTEVYDVTPSSYPGVFNMSGYASEGFNISGALIISSRNVVNVYALSDFGVEGTLLSSLSGKTDPIKGTGKLKGVDINGGKFSVVTVKQ